jgi:antitoxin (DNA-binding transcriptional repressor) of toxin-antitoxin stability system
MANETVIGVTDFKARCLGLIDDVAQGRVGRVVLRKRDRAIAAIVPLAQPNASLWGALRGSVSVPPGVDVTASTGEAWKAEG